MVDEEGLLKPSSFLLHCQDLINILFEEGQGSWEEAVVEKAD